MKRAALVLCFLGLSMSSGLSAEPASPEPDLETLRARIFQVPGKVFRSETTDGTCTVSNDCGAAPTISCSSSVGDCHSGYDWVECDGNRTYCQPPSCTAWVNCPTGGPMACPNGTQYCETWGRYCLMCDGTIHRCPGTTCPF